MASKGFVNPQEEWRKFKGFTKKISLRKMNWNIQIDGKNNFEIYIGWENIIGKPKRIKKLTTRKNFGKTNFKKLREDMCVVKCWWWSRENSRWFYRNLINKISKTKSGWLIMQKSPTHGWKERKAIWYVLDSLGGLQLENFERNNYDALLCHN